MLYAWITIAGLLTGCGICGIAWCVRKRARIAAQTKAQRNLLCRYEARLAGISNYASNHYNAMGADIARGMYEIQTILGSVHRVLETIEFLGERNNCASILTAEQLLQSMQHYSSDEQCNTDTKLYQLDGVELHRWSTTIECKLEQLDSETVKAATSTFRIHH